MENRLTFDSTGRAAAFYEGLSAKERGALAVALEHIRENPAPDGKKITAVLKEPVVIYYYDDGTYKVSYTLSYIPSEERFEIAIYSISAA